jgi:hypothetical protein
MHLQLLDEATPGIVKYTTVLSKIVVSVISPTVGLND